MTLLDDLKKKLREKGKEMHSLKYLLHRTTHCPYRYIFLSDKYLSPLSVNQVKDFLDFDMTDRKPYKNEIWDCDNYALRVMSNAQIYFIERENINPAFGLYWTHNHAKNLYYCTDGTIHFIEPQLDVETKLLSPARFVLM